MIQRPRLRASVEQRRQLVAVAVQPVGLEGELRKIARVVRRDGRGEPVEIERTSRPLAKSQRHVDRRCAPATPRAPAKIRPGRRRDRSPRRRRRRSSAATIWIACMPPPVTKNSSAREVAADSGARDSAPSASRKSGMPRCQV